jgi:hypothetical protein
MALPLPNLDDRTYADLVEEARALIPALSPEWTNHNASDPGITLVEFFAWLTEMLIYRTNQVPPASVVTFLRLLNGPGWSPSGDLPRDTRATMLALRQRYRAVSRHDFERLSTEDFNELLAAAKQAEAAGEPLERWWRESGLDELPENLPSRLSRIQRAFCVPERDLTAPTEEGRRRVQPGRVSVLIVPDADRETGWPAAVEPQLSRALRGYLLPRRMLGTRHQVAGAVYVPISAEVLVARRTDLPAEALQREVRLALESFLHPLRGGPEGEGWPFGRDLYVSELYALLDAIPGVDYIADLALSSACPPPPAECVAAEPLLHPEGDSVGLALQPHHLPSLAADDVETWVADRFVAVEISTVVAPAADTPPQTVKAAVKREVQSLFHPGHGFYPGHDDPDGSGAVVIGVAEVETRIENLAEVESVVVLSIRADPQNLGIDELSSVVTIRFPAGELADARVRVALEGEDLL